MCTGTLPEVDPAHRHCQNIPLQGTITLPQLLGLQISWPGLHPLLLLPKVPLALCRKMCQVFCVTEVGHLSLVQLVSTTASTNPTSFFWIRSQTNFKITKLSLNSLTNYTSFLNWLINEMQASSWILWCKLVPRACQAIWTPNTALSQFVKLPQPGLSN